MDYKYSIHFDSLVELKEFADDIYAEYRMMCGIIYERHKKSVVYLDDPSGIAIDSNNKEAYEDFNKEYNTLLDKHGITKNNK